MDAKDPQVIFLELENEISGLAARLMNSNGKSLPEALELSHLFLDWTAKASLSCGDWAGEIQALAKKIVVGLQSGRSHEEAIGRLSTAMTEASENLDKETLGMDSLLRQGFPLRQDFGGQAPGEKMGAGNDGFFNIPPDDMASFKDFIGEAPEHLEAIERNLLSLSRGEKWDLAQVFRAFHTLKGICGFMGLNQMGALAHKAEAMLEPFKAGGKPPEDQVDWLLQACDLVREQIKAIAQGLSASRFRIVSFKEQTETPEPLHPSSPLRPADLGGSDKSDGEKIGTASAGHTSREGDASIRISVEKMDLLLEAVGELAICQSQVSGGVEGLKLTGYLASETARLGKISRQLQDIVLSLRMVPVHPLFLRMSRLARDLSRKTGKPLQLDLKGGETEIDRRMVESLTEPLVHLIRNAVDHGIDTAEERVRAGKPAEALLKLSARHQGGDFVLELADDGRGLNFGRLAHQARVMGLLAPGETPDRDRLVELIFLPGFSTAEKVTEVSGRGVGLDSVKRKIQALKGSIKVLSETGKGTTFCLRIPLTLALMDGILVRVGLNRYVLPAFQVQGFLALEGTEEHSVGSGSKWLATRQGHLPLIDLERGFGSRRDGKLRPVVVQVEAAGKGACLMVDEVLGKQQVVIKELGEGLHELKGVSGGAILGDGRVGLILDMEALMALHSQN